MTQDTLQTLAQLLVTTQGGVWTSKTAAEQAAAIATVTTLFTQAAAMVSPKISPTPPGMSPNQRFHLRRAAGAVGKPAIALPTPRSTP